ncbi:unnamed protein product, partial [Heterotrigona itama]
LLKIPKSFENFVKTLYETLARFFKNRASTSSQRLFVKTDVKAICHIYIYIYLIRNVHTSYYYKLSMYIVVKRTMKYSKTDLFRRSNMLNKKKKKK